LIAVRNEKVAGDIAAGATQKEVAEKIGVTPQRVGQIMKEKPADSEKTFNQQVRTKQNLRPYSAQDRQNSQARPYRGLRSSGTETYAKT
jgi:DNA-binding XRE family transcriptional regulator